MAILLRCHVIAADPQQIRHRMGTSRVGVTEILRCTKEFGLKAKAQRTSWNRLAVTPLPAIAALRDGSSLILGKVIDDKLLVQRPLCSRPESITQAQLEAIWDGDISLMARRAALTDLARRSPYPLVPQRASRSIARLLRELLTASFFLQDFALVAPLFFQVVIDKVLAHQTISTLDVLAIGSRRVDGVRDRSRHDARPSVRAHDKPHRRRARRQTVPSPDGHADRIFPDTAASAIRWHAPASWRTSASS